MPFAVVPPTAETEAQRPQPLARVCLPSRSPPHPAQRSLSPAPRVLDESKAFFPSQPGCLPPTCHPPKIPFSLASNAVITYHHRPGTLAAVHFLIYSSRCYGRGKTSPWGPRALRKCARHSCSDSEWVTYLEPLPFTSRLLGSSSSGPGFGGGTHRLDIT